MKNKPINDASRYLSRLATEIRTPQQRLKNLGLMPKIVCAVSNGRVSAEVGKFFLDRIIALDDKAEQQGIEDPLALAL